MATHCFCGRRLSERNRGNGALAAGGKQNRHGVDVPVEVPSIFRRQEKCGCASVSSDDPDSGAIGECVCRQQPETALHRKFISWRSCSSSWPPSPVTCRLRNVPGLLPASSSAASAPGVATIRPSGNRSPIYVFLQLELLGVVFEGRECSLVVYGLHEFCQTYYEVDE